VSPYHTPLRCIGPILTTWRTFSLFRIPSRRPRVMPATLSSLVPLIIWLSATDRSINSLSSQPGLLTFSTGNADTTGFYLKAKTTLILPESGSHTGLHSRRCNLAGRVEASLIRVWRQSWLATNAGQRQDRWACSHVWYTLRAARGRCQTICIPILPAIMSGGILRWPGLQEWWLLVGVVRSDRLRWGCWTRGHVLLVIHLWSSCIHRLILVVSR